MARPSPAQLRARREFVRRFGHKGRHRENHRPRRRHRNPEGEGSQHHESKRGWIMPVVLIGGALLLFRGTAFGNVLGAGGIGGGSYTAVGTDATGHPIYQGAVGSTPPVGYSQTGVSATGQPIYSYSGTPLGMVGTLVGAGGGIVGIFKNLFGGGGASVPGGGGGGISSTLPGGGGSVTSPDILTGGGVGLPDINLPNLSTVLTDISLPDLNLETMFGPAFDFGSPQLSLSLQPAVAPDAGSIVAGNVPDLSSFWAEF